MNKNYNLHEFSIFGFALHTHQHICMQAFYVADTSLIPFTDANKEDKKPLTVVWGIAGPWPKLKTNISVCTYFHSKYFTSNWNCIQIVDPHHRSRLIYRHFQKNFHRAQFIAPWHFDFFCWFICCFMYHWRICHSYGDITICRWRGLKILAFAWHLRPLSSEGSLACRHILWHGTSSFTVSSEGQEKPSASTKARTGGPPLANRALYHDILTSPPL